MAQLIRITAIDRSGSASFGSEGHVLKMVLAACARNPESIEQILTVLATLDPDAARSVRSGLDRFDEFVLPDQPETIDAWLAANDPTSGQPFRLVDPRLREATLTPLELGIVVFNLPDRRVIQVENRYGTLLRKDRGRMRRDGRPVAQIYRYELPDDWSLLP